MSSKIVVQRAEAPVVGVTVVLLPFEDREMMGEESGGALLVRPHLSEPECFELRADLGYQVLNKGEMKKFAQGLLDLVEADDRKGREG